jgi:hypothetical protein
MTDKNQEEQPKEQPKPRRHPAEIIGDVLSIYATLLNGQIIKAEGMLPEEQLAAVMCAADVLQRAHVIVLAQLGAQAAGVPWVVGPEKIEQTAQAIATRMVER